MSLDAGKRLHNPVTGKFIQKPKGEKLIAKNIALLPQHLADIEALLEPGETLSSFVREAIANYIELRKSLK